MTSAREFQQAERRFIETLRPRFEQKGYEFRSYPTASDLPAFMETFAPDAIALKPDHKIAIEVKSRRNRANDLSIRVIRHIFQAHPEWQFRVFYIADSEQDSIDIPTSTWNVFFDKLATTRDLLAHGQSQAAFLMSWSLLEAAARMADADLRGRPQSPGTVVQALAMNGTIKPETERYLRNLIHLRNRVAHGDLEAETTEADVERILSIAQSVSESRGKA